MDDTKRDPHRSEERLTGHAFDGIEEYDNPTPGWWHMIFIGSIVFSFLYFAFFNGELGWTPQGAHHQARMRYFQSLFGELGTLEPDEQTILGLMGDEQWRTVGAGVFATNCANCHGADAGGGVGPNLTDDAYINVNGVTDIYDIITDGVVVKGMPAWGVRLTDNQRIVVSSYVAWLRGQNVTGGTQPEPESKVIDPWPAVAGE